MQNGECPNCGSTAVYSRTQGSWFEQPDLYVQLGPTGQTVAYVTYICTMCGYFVNIIADKGALAEIAKSGLWMPVDGNGIDELPIKVQLETQDNINELVLQIGVPAKARIVKVIDSGLRVSNGQGAVMNFELEVSAADGTLFSAKTMASIGVSALAKYAAGKTVFVKYNPGDKSQVAIDHS